VDFTFKMAINVSSHKTSVTTKTVNGHMANVVVNFLCEGELDSCINELQKLLVDLDSKKKLMNNKLSGVV
jgi:hypothetical protein